MKKKHSLSHMAKMARSTDFSLPAGVGCDKVLRQDGHLAYIFRSKELGDLGHLLFLAHPGGTQCVYEVAGEPDDPMTAKRCEVFAPIAEYVSSKMEMICGKGGGEVVPYQLQPESQIIESKLMPCNKCGSTTSMMVIAPNAETPGQLENYARLMLSVIR